MVRALAAVALLGAMTVVGAPAGAAAPEPRWHDGACAADDQVGVTIVVDFQELGGGVNVRCTERAPTDGADALDAAGIAWQGVVRWGRGFVCKIAGKPADDPCIDTPPASAYWSYWLAPRGGEWCYSNLGVLNRTPPPGSVEGWSFSLDRDGGQSPPPGIAPPAAAPGTTPRPLGPADCDPGGGSVPTTTTTTSRPAPPGGGTAIGIPGTAPSDGPGSPPGDGGSTSTTAADGATTSTGSTTTSTTTSTTAPDRSDGERARSDTDGGADEQAAGGLNPTDLSSDGTDDGGGFPVSTAAGAGLVVALAGAAAVIARRRRVGAVDEMA